MKDHTIIKNSADNPHWIMTPLERIDLLHDPRYLIPFMTKFHKIGMINHNGNVVINPEYDVISNDIYSKSDLLVVGKLYPYWVGSINNVDARVRYHYGALKANGDKLLDINYRLILLGINSDRITVESENREFCVFDKNGNTIVPFKKYKKIDGFDNNLARVVDYNDNWGIINERGDLVLPTIYSKIWNFYGKDKQSTKLIHNGIEEEVRFCDLVNTINTMSVLSHWHSFNSTLKDLDDDIDDSEYERDTWDALTDGQYGDMPDDFDGDYSFLGY